MKVLTKREVLQSIIRELGDSNKLKSPTSEVVAMPNWMLRKIIKLRK